MAKKAKAKEKKFLIGWSECGRADQISADGDELFETAAKAKAHIEKNVRAGDYSSTGAHYVLQIVAESKAPEEIEWK